MIDFILGTEPVHLEVVPARVSPFKEDTPPTAGRDRLNMLELGLKTALAPGHAGRCRIRTLELEREGPSYSVETLEALSEETPNDPPAVLIGSDSLSGLPKWKDPERILGNHAVWIFQRPGSRADETTAMLRELAQRYPGPGFRLLDNPLSRCSSTQVRRSLAQGDRENECLPAAILQYIRTHQLYGTNGEPHR